jgi:hypothetical protein
MRSKPCFQLFHEKSFHLLAIIEIMTNFVHPNAFAVASVKAQRPGLIEIPKIEISL